MEDVNIGSLALYRCKQRFTPKDTRFARAVFGVFEQNNAVVRRQLWGQLFLQANLRREDLNSIALQVAQVAIDEEIRRHTCLLSDNQYGPFEVAIRQPRTSQQWKGLVLYLNVNITAFQPYNL